MHTCIYKHSFLSPKIHLNLFFSIYQSFSLSVYSNKICGIYHHHHVVRPARISLTLSLHVSRSFIASGRSSGLHPVSSHSCCMYIRAGHPAFDWPYAGGPQEYITYELVLASPAVSGMTGLSSLDSFHDRW